MTEKQVQHWFLELPLQARVKALNNTSAMRLLAGEPTLKDALTGAFRWDKTAEGFAYWEGIFKALL